MMTRKFSVVGSVFLGLGLLGLTPAVHRAGTVAGSPLPTSGSETPSQHTQKTPSGSKPIAAWHCTASWYGEDFDGLTTAAGETYDMYGATAAHPTLPLGSIVRVTNSKNHRSQIVRINDRGPYVNGRELDVSYQVARNLGFDQHGTARVQVELLQLPSHSAVSHGN